jgi:hypothetical protein
MVTSLKIGGTLLVSSGVGDSWSATCRICIQEKLRVWTWFCISKLLCISTATSFTCV